MSSVFEALSHPIRREVLEMLKEGGKTAGQLSEQFPVSKPTMSGHFNKLKAAGLVRSENSGGNMVYTINMSTLEEALLGFMGRMGLSEDAQEATGRSGASGLKGEMR